MTDDRVVTHPMSSRTPTEWVCTDMHGLPCGLHKACPYEKHMRDSTAHVDEIETPSRRGGRDEHGGGLAERDSTEALFRRRGAPKLVGDEGGVGTERGQQDGLPGALPGLGTRLSGSAGRGKLGPFAA